MTEMFWGVMKNSPQVAFFGSNSVIVESAKAETLPNRRVSYGNTFCAILFYGIVTNFVQFLL